MTREAIEAAERELDHAVKDEQAAWNQVRYGLGRDREIHFIKLSSLVKAREYLEKQIRLYQDAKSTETPRN